MLETIG